MGATKKTAMELRELEELSEENISALPSKPSILMNKRSMNYQVIHIVAEVNNGNVNPLEAFVYLNFMAKIADAAKKKLLDQAIDEADKYPEKEVELYDATVTVKNGAGRYDYSGIKEIEEKEKELMELKEKAKSAYAAKLAGNIITDKETGEIINPAKYKPNSKNITIRFR